jgi:uncharacterized membrane protein YqaE (UPF0057 family)
MKLAYWTVTEVVMDILRIIVAIVVPPLGVFMQEGLRKRFWINLVLTLFGYVPGIIHAVYVIMKYEPRRQLPTSRYYDDRALQR